MYQGAVVESGPTAEVLGRPQHPTIHEIADRRRAAAHKRQAAPFPADRLWRAGDGFAIEDLARKLAHGHLRTRQA
jgi:ABC-type glutathione transport system ATPase component